MLHCCIVKNCDRGLDLENAEQDRTEGNNRDFKIHYGEVLLRLLWP